MNPFVVDGQARESGPCEPLRLREIDLPDAFEVSMSEFIACLSDPLLPTRAVQRAAIEDRAVIPTREFVRVLSDPNRRLNYPARPCAAPAYKEREK